MDTSSPQRSPSAVIIAGGDKIEPGVLARLPRQAHVIAADSGLNHAERLGLTPAVVVGDLDSADPASVVRATAAGAIVERHPVDKDATDLELALSYAVAHGYDHIVLVGGHGGRLSHLIGNALLLTSDTFAKARIEWHVRNTSIVVVRPFLDGVFEGTQGDIVSLLATGGPAEGVTTEGLRWKLVAATLPTGSTRGISNEMTATECRVSLESGVLLAIQERKAPA